MKAHTLLQVGFQVAYSFLYVCLKKRLEGGQVNLL